jgi:uncharacterized protein
VKPRPASGRVRVRRLERLAVYDFARIHAILDAMPVATIGCIFRGSPLVTPTLQWREGNVVYWHGSAASRMLDAAGGAEVCLNVTLIDGMVLARSAFNHAMNYRSVTLFGRAERVADVDEKRARLQAFMEQRFPSRWETLRPLKARELKATTILSLPIREASAKVRSGPPREPAADLSWPVWAGEIPIELRSLAPIADLNSIEKIVPPHVGHFKIGQARGIGR